MAHFLFCPHLLRSSHHGKHVGLRVKPFDFSFPLRLLFHCFQITAFSDKHPEVLWGRRCGLSYKWLKADFKDPVPYLLSCIRSKVLQEKGWRGEWGRETEKDS